MSYLPLLCTFLLLLASVTTHAQPYTLAIDPVVDTVTVGELSTFTISVLPSEGFDASVFINAWSPTRSR